MKPRDGEFPKVERYNGRHVSCSYYPLHAHLPLLIAHEVFLLHIDIEDIFLVQLTC
ncbi:hypothetical protein I3842_14G085800 [Carya illinoinensis]|uniref:Uncharacterized protein n=1 Tax=Carya illinoinensis TaxID=32201 RepID=A0A922DAT2_CARIL|nr:hypothetical protein I3842_14G085800 [Carya illinoinensis]